MAYENHLLFNNIFLKNLSPSEEEMAAARYLVHSSARDWFGNADLSSPTDMVRTWIRPLLNQQSLDLVPAEPADDNTWNIVAPWDREQPLALCYVAPHRTDLNGYVDGVLPKGRHWTVRAVNLARRSGVQGLRWVVLTNGEQWRLLDACALRRYEAFLEIDLYHLLSGEDDPMAAYLFYRLLRLEDSLEYDEDSGKNKLDALIELSTKATEATERYLKTSVSYRLETPGGGDGIMAQLCMGLVHAIDPDRTKSFTAQERDAIYRDATYLLYRLLFILYAEARSLLPMDRDDYRAVSLRNLIDEAVDLRQSPQKAADRPTSLWKQLSTLFSAIQYSDEYLGIPAYNGGLFEDKDKPYLREYAIENKFLAEALCELAFLPDPEADRPPEPIDYCDLSVRHLGSLYEGMIEYKLFIASEKLYARRGKDNRVQYLSAAKASLKPNDEVVEPGKVYFAQSPQERKATGTHYTAEELVERLVQQTVMRLLAECWASFQPKLEAWLAEIEATPTEAGRVRLQNFVDSQIEAFVREQVLSLRICDMAMGSGHFLVYTAYAVTNFILQVLTSTPWDNPAINLDANYWRRLVVENCLYGVDINGMAVELAKLSLWLATMQAGRPLSFLNHHMKRGNSLMGARLEEITSVLTQSDLSKETRATKIAEARGQYALREIPQVMQKIEQANRLLDKIAGRVIARAEDIARQESDYDAVQELLQPYKRIGDLLVARDMGLKIADHELRAIANAIEQGQDERLSEEQRAFIGKADSLLNSHETHHWELEYPRIFLANDVSESVRGNGFDVLVGNPPFLGGYKIGGELGRPFADYLRKAYVPAKGQADLCSHMFRRAFEIVRKGGYMGMVATNTIGQGDTRKAGLAAILEEGGIIFYAKRYVRWPGDATVEVNLVAIRKTFGELQLSSSSRLLDGTDVPFISSWLDDFPEIEPSYLLRNSKRAFIGDALRGIGFVLEPDEAALLLNDARNSECVLPYLNGQDLNSDPRQNPSRYVICFHDWEFKRAQRYPVLMELVRERVKPQRDKVKEKRERTHWWRFARYRGELRKATSELRRVLVRSEVSEHHMLVFVPRDCICSHMLIVFAYDDYFHFALLQSSLHEFWLRRQASTLETRNRYTPTDCFQTFPFPQSASVQAQLAAEVTGQNCYNHRQQYMLANQVGLTKTYNLFHDPIRADPEIQEMRRLHAEMDQAILACYNWKDINLEHDFYPNDRKKIRYMPSLPAQREIFTRLTALNQKFAEQEAAQGLAAESDESEKEGVDTDDV